MAPKQSRRGRHSLLQSKQPRPLGGAFCFLAFRIRSHTVGLIRAVNGAHPSGMFRMSQIAPGNLVDRFAEFIPLGTPNILTGGVKSH